MNRAATTAEPRMKGRIQDLALLGGPPAFDEPLHVGRPNIGDRQALQRRIDELLDRNWLTNDGPFVREFEQRIADMVGVRHCVAMTNATIALEIAIRALGMTGEVIVPAFTFVATAHALQWQEITPVFCDIDPLTHTIDPSRAAELITPKTSGILGVHLWGGPADVGALTALAGKHDLALLFDAAHAFGCSYMGTPVGRFGSAEVFSFHATKFLNSFEGGAVVTDDDDLASRLKLMRNFGFSGYDRVIYVGTNGKMTEIAAAMGITSLEAMDSIVSVNRRNYERYRTRLAGVPGIRMLPVDDRGRSNYQYVVLEIAAEEAQLSRDRLLQVLWAENVLARRYFYPAVHRMEPYRSHFPHASLVLPETERICGRVMTLPTGSAVDDASVDLITSVIRVALSGADEIERRVPAPTDEFLNQPPPKALPVHTRRT